jgi:hypothetical protein
MASLIINIGDFKGREYKELKARVLSAQCPWPLKVGETADLP